MEIRKKNEFGERPKEFEIKLRQEVGFVISSDCNRSIVNQKDQLVNLFRFVFVDLTVSVSIRLIKGIPHP